MFIRLLPAAMLLATFIHCAVGTCSTASDKCPQHCSCSESKGGGLIVDCIGQSLTKPPHQLPVNTAELLLNGNFISELSDISFMNCSQLLLLDLSRNRLGQLTKGSFSSAASIEKLYLNDNRLQYDRIPVDVFRRLKKLRVLHLHNNIWKFLTRYPAKLFCQLLTIEILTLDGFEKARFEKEFSNMMNLKSLHIYGGLQVVRNDTFIGFRETPITDLSIKTDLSLYHLEPESFSHFPELRSLDLGYNRNLGFENVSNAWWGLQFTKITKLVLTRIVTLTDQASKLPQRFFKFLNLTKIDTLLLDKNNIVEMESLLSANFPLLVYLDMSYNRLANIASFLEDLFYLRYLKYLDCSHQTRRYSGMSDGFRGQNLFIDQQTQLPPGVKANRKLNEPLSINDWFTTCRTPPLQPCSSSPHRGLPSLTSSVNGRPLPTYGTWCIMLPPHLEIALLTESVNYDINMLPSIVLFNSEHLSYVAFGNNGITNLAKPIVMANPCSITLDFSNNGLYCLAPDFFNYSKNLGSNLFRVNFSGNNLANQLELDTEGLTFTKFGQTVELNLARNRIKVLPAKIFSHTIGLEKLNLSQNDLRSLDFEFEHMTRLTELDLSYNILTAFSNVVINNLTTIFHSDSPVTNLLIDLTGNPLQCSCETLPFLRWISSNKNHMINYNHYSCWYNQTFVPFSRLSSHIIVDLSNICSRRLAIILSASLCSFSLILVVSLACIYRHRWEMRYWCLWLTQRSKLYRELADDSDYDFDAFVVYASQDGLWVRNEMVPHLECDKLNCDNLESSISAVLPVADCHKPFKLCVHERDFILGDDIIGNIWSMMERSRKVVLVISRGFVQSNYCNYEMNLARVQSVQKGRNLFIPIVLEQVDLESMSDGLRWIVRKLTYIEWPREEHRSTEREEFWEKVREALDDSGLSINFRTSDQTAQLITLE